MKLLIVSSWCPCPPDNGSKIRAHELITRLSRRHDVTLLSFAEPHEVAAARALETSCRVRTVTGSPYTSRRLAVRHLFSGTPRSLMQTFSAAMQGLVDGLAPEHDAALALQIGAAPYVVRQPLPKVLEELEVGVLRDRVRRAQGFRRMRAGMTWWKLSRYAHTLVDTFDRTTVVSVVERGHLAAAGCDLSKVRVVPNGAAVAPVTSSNTSRAASLIYPGSVTYAANLDAVQYFIEDIYPLIRARRPDATLSITGATGNVNTRPLEAVPGVEFTGRVADVKRLVADSAVCVVPLRVGGGTRLKVLEAMALGTPVVSTSKGIEGLDIIPDRDVLVGDDPECFARQVVRALSDVPLRRRLAASARRTVEERFTWDGVAADVDNVLSEAVERHASTRTGSAEERYRAAGA